MVLKNDRVRNILDFIEKFHVCDVSHVAKLFYPNNKYSEIDASNKLLKLYREGTLRRKRCDLNLKYLYYIKEPSQIYHKLTIVDLYVKLCNIFGNNNIEIDLEYTGIDSIRPDAFLKIRSSRREYLFFVEIHISNNKFNLEKYESVYYSNLTEFPKGVFPTILAVSNRNISIKTNLLNVLLIKSNIDSSDLIKLIS